MITITLNYNGQLREAARQESEIFTADKKDITLENLIAERAGLYGELFRKITLDEHGKLNPSLIIAVNGTVVDKNTPYILKDNDEITLIPPIAGG